MFIVVLYSLMVMAQDHSHPSGEKVMRYQCGACHIASIPTANKEALRIFDLDNKMWAKILTKTQKTKVLDSLKGRVGLTDKELSYLMPKGWTPLPHRPSSQEIEAVKTYLEGQKVHKSKLSDFIAL